MTPQRQDCALPLRGKWLLYFLIVAGTEAAVHFLFPYMIYGD